MKSSKGDAALDPFELKLMRRLAEDRLAAQGDRILAAVSGGADSTALLLALSRIGPRYGLEIFAFHFNHQLRQEADSDEDFVRRLCSRLNAELVTSRTDVRSEAQRRGLNLEACARKLRYRRLLGEARRRKAVAATGHTLDDQAETVLLRLARGAGIKGLAAIRDRWKDQDGLTVIRPLLRFERREVIEYLNRCGQDFREDASNRDTSLDRNWVRRRLLPPMKKRLNPAVIRTLGRSARLFDQIRDYLESEAKAAADTCLGKSEGEVIVLLPELLSRHPALRTQILRRAVDSAALSVGGTCPELTSAHYKALLDLAGAPHGEADLPNGWRAVREFEELRLTRRRPVGPIRRQLRIPGSIRLEEVGKSVTIQPAPTDAMASAEGVLLKLEVPVIEVRNRCSGDRYRLSEETGSEKLKRLFQERRVPKTLRDRLIVLESGGRVVWVEGFPPDPAHQGPDDPGIRYEVLVELLDS